MMSASSSPPSFVFEGTDGVNMEGLLSDSESSDSSSDGVTLNMNAMLHNASHNHHHHQSQTHHHHLLHGNNGNHHNGHQQQQLNHHHSHQSHVTNQSDLYQQPQVNQQQNSYQTPSHHQPMNGFSPSTSNSQSNQESNKRKADDLSSSSSSNREGNTGGNKGSGPGDKKKTSPPNGKKTKGRVKIKMEFIDNKLRRYTTFSKRKTGIMKKVRIVVQIDAQIALTDHGCDSSLVNLLSFNRHTNYQL